MIPSNTYLGATTASTNRFDLSSNNWQFTTSHTILNGTWENTVILQHNVGGLAASSATDLQHKIYNHLSCKAMYCLNFTESAVTLMNLQGLNSERTNLWKQHHWLRRWQCECRSAALQTGAEWCRTHGDLVANVSYNNLVHLKTFRSNMKLMMHSNIFRPRA